MANIDYEGFVAGAGVKASALNMNFSKAQDAITEVERSLNLNVSTLEESIALKASKGGSVDEFFNVKVPEEEMQAANKKYVDEKHTELASKVGVDVEDLGDVSGDITLSFDKAFMAKVGANSRIILTAPKEGYHNCLLRFTINDGISLSLPENCKMNQGFIPVLSNGVTHRLTFDTLNEGADYTVYYGKEG